MASITRWSLSDVEHFLSLYEHHSVLWDVNHEGFFNKQLRQQALHNLLKQLQIEGLESNLINLKAKIKNIRDIYRMELRRLLKYNKQSKENTVEDELYKPKIAWFKKADSFLRKSVMKRTRKTNTDYQNEIQTWISGVPMDAPLENSYDYMPNEYRSYQRRSLSSETLLSQLKSPPTSKDCGQLPESLCSLRTQTISKDQSLFPSTISSPLATPHTCIKKYSEDPYELFGKYVVAQIRALPMRTSVLLQQEIQHSITRAVLSCMNCDSHVFLKSHEK